VRKILKWVAIVMAFLGVSTGSWAIFIAVRGIPSYDHPVIQFRAESNPEVAHGRKLVRLLCMDCHFDPATGALTGKRMHDVPSASALKSAASASSAIPA